MKRKIFLAMVVFAIAGVPALSAEVLHGIPDGNFTTLDFTVDPCGVFPGQGRWNYHVTRDEGGTPANAYVDFLGTGDARHVELSCDWFPRTSMLWWADDANTPSDSAWRISADVTAYAGGNEDGQRTFSMGKGPRQIANQDFYASGDTFLMVFDGVYTIKGYAIFWKAGDITGTSFSETSIIGLSAPKTVSIEYNPITGIAKGMVGSEIVFHEGVARDLDVNTVTFTNVPYGYDTGYFSIDNVKSELVVYNLVGPTVKMWEPNLPNSAVCTGASGVNSIKILWSERVMFEDSCISVVNGNSISVPFTSSGSNSACMVITFDQPLLYDDYTITVDSSVYGADSFAPIDGNGDGQPGGDAVFLVKHSKRNDFNNDNSVDLVDLDSFATNWLVQN